jgi:hypothetical protein
VFPNIIQVTQHPTIPTLKESVNIMVTHDGDGKGCIALKIQLSNLKLNAPVWLSPWRAFQVAGLLIWRALAALCGARERWQSVSSR